MAYENYSQVSWTDGTPITGDRLQQMSTNTQQVKEANEDSPQGIKKLKSVTSNSATITTFATTTEIISLKNDSGTGGPDNRVSVDASRFYKVVLNFTGFVLTAKGAEDSRYFVSLHSGTHGGANSKLCEATFTPPAGIFVDSANSNTITLRNDAYDNFFGSGTISTVLQSNASGFINESFFAAVKREQGASTSGAPGYFVPASSGSYVLQLYVEDAGGIA